MKVALSGTKYECSLCGCLNVQPKDSPRDKGKNICKNEKCALHLSHPYPFGGEPPLQLKNVYFPVSYVGSASELEKLGFKDVGELFSEYRTQLGVFQRNKTDIKVVLYNLMDFYGDSDFPNLVYKYTSLTLIGPNRSIKLDEIKWLVSKQCKKTQKKA